MSVSTTLREKKGKSRIAFPTNYTVVDLETTGLSPFYDEIIEVAALRVRDGVVVDSFQSLVKPTEEIDDFIAKLTGITNEMLSTAPLPRDVLPLAFDFIGDDIVVGHNVNFDVNFLYDWSEANHRSPFANDFVDTMRLSRSILSGLSHHRLKDVSEELNISPNGYHRALCDCYTTHECLVKLHDRVRDTQGVDEFVKSFKRKRDSRYQNLKNITTQNDSFDETHPLFGKRCVFTGALEKLTRTEAAQLVVDVGGVCENGVTLKTNYLILGNNDYCKSIKDGKSSKQKKAEDLKLKGHDIEILPESVFYDMLGELPEAEHKTAEERAPIIIDGISVTDYEAETIALIRSIIANAGLDSSAVHVDRRAEQYLTLFVREWSDFCRIKITDRTKWFSLDMCVVPQNIKEQETLSIVNNKNQRHWKIPLSSIKDIENYAEFVIASFNGSLNCGLR